MATTEKPQLRTEAVPSAPLAPGGGRRSLGLGGATASPALVSFGVLLLAYLVPLLIVPPTLATPLIDDWNYLISVRHLIEDGELWVAPWTAASLVLQIGWGALFALPFGVDPVPLRWSTIVLSFAGVAVCGALFRELGVSHARATAGALAVWFNPIFFGLSYTFMTDVPYVALFAAATWATVRAVNRGAVNWLAIGSGFAGLAFLVRQQGALLPLATLLWLLIARPAWFRAERWRAIEATITPCLVAVVGYLAWTSRAGLPSTQSDYLDSLQEAGVWGTLDLVWRLAIVGVFFLGVFTFPIVVGAVDALPAAWRRAGPAPRHAVILLAIGLVVWTRWYFQTRDGRAFPFVPWGSMLHEDGLGVLDAEGLRPFFFERWEYVTIGLVFGVAALIGLMLLAGRSGPPATGERRFWGSLGGLIAVIGLGQFGGMIPPSIHIRQFLTFDRYYLPLLPLAVGLVLWAVRDKRLAPAPIALALAIYATVGVVGVQDWFAFKRGQWDTATWLVEEQGVPLGMVDGAAQWDGMHFYEQHLANPNDWAIRRPGDPWWLWIVAPMIDPAYVVAASPAVREGYTVMATRPYESWIRSDEHERIYIWRRFDAPPALVPPPALEQGTHN